MGMLATAAVAALLPMFGTGTAAGAGAGCACCTKIGAFLILGWTAATSAFLALPGRVQVDADAG